ncbi:murein L,D-transpeptidase catalytic domain family protein [Rhizorhabdus histidinilytica]|uniref:murein L,D-transpeptidase catalytic domain family protein n=1 Tax=Rhizorhabdus histidinilytica TaxID=439228 RepID=UPI002E2DB681|nr:murein L,D-transpeptidase catalytic domain family protein [Rhizorhabdus histidinilytica]
MTVISRRHLLLGGGAVVLGMVQTRVFAVPPAPVPPRPILLQRALGALDRHRATIRYRDVIGIVDFSQASRVPRFHIVDVMSGRSQSLLVAHGRGSDPDHSGWLERFSNSPGSQASSAGAYLVGSGYSGKHGRSQRLIGLDCENSNAEARAIVIHAASYVSQDIALASGKLGRSQGCFAVSQANIGQVLERLGPGRMIYAGKI